MSQYVSLHEAAVIVLLNVMYKEPHHYCHKTVIFQLLKSAYFFKILHGL
jgi:hypothetical protein